MHVSRCPQRYNMGTCQLAMLHGPFYQAPIRHASLEQVRKTPNKTPLLGFVVTCFFFSLCVGLCLFIRECSGVTAWKEREAKGSFFEENLCLAQSNSLQYPNELRSLTKNKRMDQLLDSLFCSEQNELDYFSDSSFYTNPSYYKQATKTECPVLLEQDLFWDDEELASLLEKEKVNQDRKIKNPVEDFAGARKEAVDWMMRVNAHFSFSALTVVLAVDYLDRFFFSFQFQIEKPWMMQLAAVACLSLAAKVEETQVPLLLDLQVEECKYVFEAKTINRMEILVLSTLDWKMNPVTPISFLDYMTRRFGLKDHLCWEFLKKCELILVNLISDSRFLSFLPSVAAAATMLHVVNDIEPCLVEYEDQLSSILRIDKGVVDDCSKLIIELSSTLLRNKRKFASSIPGSPNGVIDISFSSDSSNDSWAVASSVSSSPEPLLKKSRALELNRIANAAAGFHSLPRLP